MFKCKLEPSTIRPLGRYFFENDALWCNNVGSGFECRFKGRLINIFLRTDTLPEYPIYLRVTVDGVSFKTSVVSSEQTIVCDGLEDREHSLKIVRISEIRVGLGVECPKEKNEQLAFTELEIAGEVPEFLAPPEDRRYKIDFYGDSITNGWGVTNDGSGDCFTPYEEDHSLSYAYIISERLNADESVLAVSGHGVVADCNGCRDYPMREFYNYISRRKEARFDHSSRRPDLIVVALGTNDEGGQVPCDEFSLGAREFIKMLRADYPETGIVWLYGMMGGKYIETLDALISELRISDRNLHFVPSEEISREKGEIGAGWHPSIVGQRRIADELEEVVCKILV